MQLFRRPSLTIVAVLTLASAVAPMATIVGLLDQVVIRGIHIDKPSELAVLKYVGANDGKELSRTDGHYYFSYPMYRELRRYASSFQGLAATAWTRAAIQWGGGRATIIDTELVSGNYFDVVRAKPVLGRLLLNSDESFPGGSPVLVLGFAYWQQECGGAQNVIGQHVLINGSPFVVVGVASRSFTSIIVGDRPSVFVPITMAERVMPDGGMLSDRRYSWINVFGRIKSQITSKRAEAELAPLWHSLRADELQEMGSTGPEFRKRFLDQSFLQLESGITTLSPLREQISGGAAVLLAISLVLSLIACANVGGLFLVRSARRSREVAVRRALGASRLRIAQLLALEGLWIAMLAASVGLILAPALAKYLADTISATSGGSILIEPSVDIRMLACCAAAGILFCLLCSIAPLAQAWYTEESLILKAQMSYVRRQSFLRKVSVAGQLALCGVLVAAALMCVSTLQKLRSVNVGFNTNNLVTLRLDPRLAGYSQPQYLPLYQALLSDLTTTAGVRAVALTTDPELSDTNQGNNIAIPGYLPNGGDVMVVEHPRVSARYFQTMQIPLLTGREFTDADRIGTHKVAVVNESFVRHFFGSQPALAIGHYVAASADATPDTEIVGVVADIQHTGIREPVDRTMYTPYLQDPIARSVAVYVRTSIDPNLMKAVLVAGVTHFDPLLAVEECRTMKEQIGYDLAQEQALAFLGSAFAALALLITGVGTYALISYSVESRIYEFAVRMALGANRRTVRLGILLEVAILVIVASVISLGLVLVLNQLVRHGLFKTSPIDPAVFGGVLVGLLTLALGAALIPAERASRVEPAIALRYE
jgi:putative ABC transport system permease protein